MVRDPDTLQRIARLTPLAEVFARIDAIGPVPAREAALDSAYGRILAQDIVATHDAPDALVARCDGYAVRAEDTRDASSYAPLRLAQPPQRVDAGETLPAGHDAVLPLDAVETAGGFFDLVGAAVPGDGVWPAGADAAAGRLLRGTGQRSRAGDLAVLASLGIPSVRVREPRVWLTHAGATPRDFPALACVRAALETAGAEVFAENDLEGALLDDTADAVIGIGGTGQGRRDAAIFVLRGIGEALCHGVGLMPGETACFGLAGGRPVLLLPGALDAAMAAWCVIGRRLLDRLSGAAPEPPGFAAPLSRKVISTIGIADFVPVRRDGDRVEPLATGMLPYAALTTADGFILVPPDSEGYPAGSIVEVRALP